jgi:hypothetical protein
MDMLEQVTGGLLTEATVDEGITAVQTYTRPGTIRQAKRLGAVPPGEPTWTGLEATRWLRNQQSAGNASEETRPTRVRPSRLNPCPPITSPW